MGTVGPISHEVRMTTIVFKDGDLAADTLMTTGNLQSGFWNKIEKTDDGRLIGCCGFLSQANELKMWLKNPPGKRSTTFKSGDDCRGMEVLPDGTVNQFNSGSVVGVAMAGPFFAIGSGDQLAMGAMAAGATAEEAIAICIKLDTYTGGEVESITINPDNNDNVVQLNA